MLSIWVKTLTDSNAMAGLTFFFMVLRRSPQRLTGRVSAGMDVALSDLCGSSSGDKAQATARQ